MYSFLRKFGLRHCDLPTMIENVGVLLRMHTVNIERNYTKRIPVIWYILTLVTGISYYYVFLISMLWFVFVHCRETGDLVAAFIVFSLGICSETGIVKILFLAYHNEKIKDIVDAYLAFDSSVDPRSRFSINLLKGLRNVKRRAVFFWAFITIDAVFYIIAPFFFPGRHFVDDLYVVYGLEPMLDNPNYQIACIMKVAGVYFAVPTETCTSAFITVTVGYVEAQLLALSSELSNLWKDSEDCFTQHPNNRNEIENRDKIMNEYITKHLKDIVAKHIMNKKLLGQVASVYRGAVAVEFMLLILSLTSELLGGLENTYIQLPYTLTQVAMDCFIGQRLIDASLAFENAVYCCKWENFDKYNQRTVYLLLMNAQKTMTLSVGGFTVLSFALFMSVVKLTYSAYTTLRSKMYHI